MDLSAILASLQNLFECFRSRILFHFPAIALWTLFFIFSVGCNITLYKSCWDKMELGKLNIYDISSFKNLCGYVFIIRQDLTFISVFWIAKPFQISRLLLDLCTFSVNSRTSMLRFSINQFKPLLSLAKIFENTYTQIRTIIMDVNDLQLNVIFFSIYKLLMQILANRFSVLSVLWILSYCTRTSFLYSCIWAGWGNVSPGTGNDRNHQ